MESKISESMTELLQTGCRWGKCLIITTAVNYRDLYVRKIIIIKAFGMRRIFREAGSRAASSTVKEMTLPKWCGPLKSIYWKTVFNCKQNPYFVIENIFHTDSVSCFIQNILILILGLIFFLYKICGCGFGSITSASKVLPAYNYFLHSTKS